MTMTETPTQHWNNHKTPSQPHGRSEDEETVGYVAQLKPQNKRLSAFDAGGTAASKTGQGQGEDRNKQKKNGEDDSKFEYREVRGSVCPDTTQSGAQPAQPPTHDTLDAHNDRTGARSSSRPRRGWASSSSPSAPAASRGCPGSVVVLDLQQYNTKRPPRSAAELNRHIAPILIYPRTKQIPSTITPGGPLLSKDGGHLVFIGWDDEPRRLGMVSS